MSTISSRYIRLGNQSWRWNSSVHWYGHIGASVFQVLLGGSWTLARSSRCLSEALAGDSLIKTLFLGTQPVRRIASSPVPFVVLTLYEDATEQM